MSSILVIKPSELPGAVAQKLSDVQRDCLAFASRTCKVVSEPRIQTFNIGSATTGKGTVVGGGLGHALGQWDVFGNIGSINMKQQTVNAHQTDIQLKLEDVKTHEQIFLSQSVPFALTLSIEKGDIVALYYTKGGLPKPLKGDIRLDDWALFLIRIESTNQLVSVGPVSSFAKPQVVRWYTYLGIVWILGVLVAPPIGIYEYSVSGMIQIACGAALIGYPLWRSYKWSEDIKKCRAQVAKTH